VNNTENAPPPNISKNKEARKLANPTGKLDSSYLSIKDLMSQGDKTSEKEEQSRDTNKPMEKFSLDDLKMNWRKYAFQAKENGLDTLFTALTMRDPVLEEDNLIRHFVDNDVQKTFLQTHETDLIGFLRRELKNWSIKLKVEEGSEDNGEKKLYSGQDKFKDMIERNPHLKTLQQKFKLDVDF
jgi:DNA polymerase-3 subunit gamma/tau